MKRLLASLALLLCWTAAQAAPGVPFNCGTPANIGGSQSVAVALAGNATAGNTAVIFGVVDTYMYGDVSLAATGFTKVHSVLTSSGGYTKDLAFLYKHSLAGGSNESVNVTQSDTTFSVFGEYLMCEIPNLTNAAPDTVVGAGTTASQSPAVTSGTLSQASMVVFAIELNGHTNTGSTTPSTYTSLRLFDQDVVSNISYKVVSATTAQALTFGTLSTSDQWGAAVTAFKITTAGTPIPVFDYHYRKSR